MTQTIDTFGYGTSEGYATQVTLPSGKLMYTGVASVCENIAREQGLAVQTIHFFGACISMNINDRAHLKFPIVIDGVNAAEFLDRIATEEECRRFLI